MSIRVMVFGTINCPEDIAQFEEAFTEVSLTVKGTPGHIQDELLRDTDDPLSVILLSEWRSKEEFLNWENSPQHRQITTPMRPYWTFHGVRRIFNRTIQLDAYKDATRYEERVK